MKVPKSSVIGVQFMGDLFHESVPDELVEQSYSVIHRTPQHIYLVLTKRSGRMLSFVSRPINKWEYSAMPIVPSWPFDNLWHGLTVCNQQEADEKIPVFLQVPGKKFLSIEPCLSQIVLDPFWMKCMGAFECDKRRPDKGKTVCHPDPCPPRINSVILGGETGPGARPMHPDWVRSVRDQCQAAGVPFFFKQWGEWGFSGAGSTHFLSSDGKMKTIESPGEDGLGAWPCRRVGRTRAGRLLDGREHNDLPWGRKVARNER
jgi:protein gp37